MVQPCHGPRHAPVGLLVLCYRAFLVPNLRRRRRYPSVGSAYEICLVDHTERPAVEGGPIRADRWGSFSIMVYL